MKKKIIIASATVLFAVATMFNMNLLQGNSVGDVSLESIAVMAQAQEEYISSGGGHTVTYECYDAPVWYSAQNDESTRMHYRVCANSQCGWAYFDTFGQTASCTVNY